MIAKMKVALVAVLVAASATTAFAQTAQRHHRAQTLTEGRNYAVAPFSAGEAAWMDRASNPHVGGN
jgi:hypothetical protein